MINSYHENSDPFAIPYTDGLTNRPEFLLVCGSVIDGKPTVTADELRAALMHLAGSSQITLPFELPKAHLPSESDEVLVDSILCGRLKFDTENPLVYADGSQLKLTLKEYNILALLGKNLGKYVANRVILKNVWGPDYELDSANKGTLRVHVNRLRNSLGYGLEVKQSIISKHVLCNLKSFGYGLFDSGELPH